IRSMTSCLLTKNRPSDVRKRLIRPRSSSASDCRSCSVQSSIALFRVFGMGFQSQHLRGCPSAASAPGTDATGLAKLPGPLFCGAGFSMPNKMIRYSFPGKVVLVTGSSRGMGAAILEAFARAGATTVLNFFDDPAGQNRQDAEQTAERLRGLKV